MLSLPGRDGQSMAKRTTGSGAHESERSRGGLHPDTHGPRRPGAWPSVRASVNGVAPRGLSLVRLAEITDLSHPFLSQVERGHARPSISSLQRIAVALDVDAGWLFGIGGTEREPVERRPGRRRPAAPLRRGPARGRRPGLPGAGLGHLVPRHRRAARRTTTTTAIGRSRPRRLRARGHGRSRRRRRAAPPRSVATRCSSPVTGPAGCAPPAATGPTSSCSWSIAPIESVPPTVPPPDAGRLCRLHAQFGRYPALLDRRRRARRGPARSGRRRRPRTA